jgi:acyl-CoA synthetase (NDP forming)
VVVVPAPFVAGVLREAAGVGAKGGLVLSAGFREAGRWDLEEELAKIPEECGFRFIGPNVQGINYVPNKMCAMFFPVIKTRGGLGIISQSGTVTAALSKWAANEGLGISAAINLGNQVDLCEADYLDYLAHDQNTRAVAMYIEGLKHGKKFLETLKRVSHSKPVVILKGGRTEAGQKSAVSHTGSLAGNHKVFSSACQQAGAIMADDLIREKCPDIIINNSTGGDPGMTPDERLCVLEANPEVATLNMGPDIMLMTLKERKAPLAHPRPERKIEGVTPIDYAEVELFAREM